MFCALWFKLLCSWKLLLLQLLLLYFIRHAGQYRDTIDEHPVFSKISPQARNLLRCDCSSCLLHRRARGVLFLGAGT